MQRCPFSMRTAGAPKCRATDCEDWPRSFCATPNLFARPAIVRTEAGVKRLARTERSQSRHTFRAEMGNAAHVRTDLDHGGWRATGHRDVEHGKPTVRRARGATRWERFRRLGPAIEHHSSFPEGTNVEFAHVEAPESRPHHDLGARVWSDVLVGHWIVRGTGSGRSVWRRRHALPR